MRLERTPNPEDKSWGAETERQELAELPGI